MKKDDIKELLKDWTQERPDLNTHPMSVVLRIHTLGRTLAEQADRGLNAHGLLWWQYDVLTALRRQGTPYLLTSSELAQAAKLTSGAMTHRIDGLERKRWVERVKDPQDRRRVLVQLTQEGLRLVESASTTRFASAARATEELSQHELQQLDQLLRKLQQHN